MVEADESVELAVPLVEVEFQTYRELEFERPEDPQLMDLGVVTMLCPITGERFLVPYDEPIVPALALTSPDEDVADAEARPGHVERLRAMGIDLGGSRS